MPQQWLVPFKGRNHSGVYDLNFLWRSDSIYIMDNHKAALWCWIRHLSAKGKYDLFHVDRHTDTLSSQLDIWVQHLPDLWQVDLDTYLHRTYRSNGTDSPLMRFDNYLSIFLKMCPTLLDTCYFATHDEGDKPKFSNLGKKFIWDIPENLSFWLSKSNHPWIVNIDFDYFCCSKDDKFLQLLADEYVTDMFSTIADLLRQGKISVLTLCLSPEWCGGWPQAERLCSVACRVLGLKFALP